MEPSSHTVDSASRAVIPAIPLAGFSLPETHKLPRVFSRPGGHRVLMIEADCDLGSFLASELREHGYAVDVVPDADGAVEVLRGVTAYDLLVLDMHLPQTDGVAQMHRLRSLLPKTPMLVLTARNGVEDKVRALHSGADDCLSRPLSVCELLARVGALMRRHSGMAAACLRVGDLLLYRDERRVERNGRRIELTPREFDLLELLMRNAGRPVSRATLLNEVWNMPGQPSTNIVDVYMKYVRDKVDLPGEIRLTHTVRGFGYELREP